MDPGGLDDALARAREAVRALAAADSTSASSSSSSTAVRAKEASRLLREVERAVEYAQRAAAGEVGSEAERALVFSRLQQVERAARELRVAVRAIVKAEGAGTQQREQLAFLLQRQPGGETEREGLALDKRGWRAGAIGGEEGGKGRGRGGGGGGVVDAVGESREVTRSLARTRELMAQELRRMGGVVEVIEEDGTSLVDTHSAHARIGTALDRADALLRRLKRQEQLDRLSKRLAFCVFLATVAFIVARRLWLPDPAPYVRLGRRVAAPLLNHARGKLLPPSSSSTAELEAPVEGSVGEEGEESLVDRAKEALRTLSEGLEEIKEMQQAQEAAAAAAEAAAAAQAAAEAAAAAAAEAAAAAAAAAAAEAEAEAEAAAQAAAVEREEGHMEGVEEQRHVSLEPGGGVQDDGELEPRQGDEQSPPQTLPVESDMEGDGEEEGGTSFIFKFEHFPRQPVPQEQEQDAEAAAAAPAAPAAPARAEEAGEEESGVVGEDEGRQEDGRVPAIVPPDLEHDREEL